MALVDPATRLSERDLDRLKERNRLDMIAARDGAIWHADTLASRAYNQAHVALLMCRTEDEVASVARGLIEEMKKLREALDATR